ncbi:uncharacterized protein LOC128884371 [Hylaeus volcanicus]|uniref:uncharacterized protein LOC128884371 n=1 Tax=Hylaeus volcanicus TaxID=313075 RepID=UPI0023B7D6BF|nr:uncharacterized protein LOC128884371 [Hylaeus volcanicus]
MTALASLPSLLGVRESGKDVRTSNVMAVQAIANILKSSLGPQGLDKMLVDDVGDVTVTNDGATILKKLEVNHPAARILVDLSHLQDQEVGDGTTTVTLIAAELLKRGNQLVTHGIHPVSVIAGYKLAAREAVKYIEEQLSTSVTNLNQETLLHIAETTLNSKLIGGESNHFSSLVVNAILAVEQTNKQGKIVYPVNSINVLKSHGQSLKTSELHDGFALARQTRASQAMPISVKQARVALLNFNLRQHRMQLGVQIQVTNPEELDKIRQKERDITKAKIEKILNTGANVILTTQGIDDMALKYFVEAKAIAVRRVDARNIARIAKCTGATLCTTLATIEGDEEFNASWLGTCDEVCEQRVGDWDFLFFKGCKTSKAKTLILRGPNESFLDEVERSVHDALCTVSKALESSSVCAGGGAVEAALSVYLEDFARTLGSKEQSAIIEFAEALLVIPRTLAINAAQDSLKLLARLRRHHHLHQSSTTKDNIVTQSTCDSNNAKWVGLDLLNGTLRNNYEAGVIEPSLSKIKSIKFATEAAVTLLRIDDVVKVEPESFNEEQN